MTRLRAARIEFRNIEGLTIENRAAHLQSIPDEVLAEIKECDVTLKGPTTDAGEGRWMAEPRIGERRDA